MKASSIVDNLGMAARHRQEAFHRPTTSYANHHPNWRPAQQGKGELLGPNGSLNIGILHSRRADKDQLNIRTTKRTLADHADKLVPGQRREHLRTIT
jgi:hypothetical protein